MNFFPAASWDFQMMQDEHGNHGRECAVGKRQRRGIAAQYSDIVSLNRLPSLAAKFVVVFEARHAGRAPPQFFRRRARPGAEFQHAVPEFVPRQQHGKFAVP